MQQHMGRNVMRLMETKGDMRHDVFDVAKCICNVCPVASPAIGSASVCVCCVSLRQCHNIII